MSEAMFRCSKDSEGGPNSELLYLITPTTSAWNHGSSRGVSRPLGPEMPGPNSRN